MSWVIQTDQGLNSSISPIKLESRFGTYLSNFHPDRHWNHSFGMESPFQRCLWPWTSVLLCSFEGLGPSSLNWQPNSGELLRRMGFPHPSVVWHCETYPVALLLLRKRIFLKYDTRKFFPILLHLLKKWKMLVWCVINRYWQRSRRYQQVFLDCKGSMSVCVTGVYWLSWNSLVPSPPPCNSNTSDRDVVHFHSTLQPWTRDMDGLHSILNRSTMSYIAADHDRN